MTKYPLAWPNGWRRTPASQRLPGRFATHGRQYTSDGQQSWRTLEAITIAGARDRVLRELRLFGVLEGDAIISTNLQLRLDGLPIGKQRQPDDPGVAVYWQRPAERGTKCMAIDQYTRVEHNLAAIAATLEAMRAIERHGGAQILERAFMGFEALPAPGTITVPWRQVLGLDQQGIVVTREEVERAYRRLRSEHHPDKGGDAGRFHAVQVAYEQAQQELGNG